MPTLLPNTSTAKELQKNYRSLFDEVIDTKEPLVILNKNKGEVVIIDIETYDRMVRETEELELKTSMHAIENYKAEKRTKKLKKLNSLADLI